MLVWGMVRKTKRSGWRIGEREDRRVWRLDSPGVGGIFVGIFWVDGMGLGRGFLGVDGIVGWCK